jgi:hypothetical protein
MENKRQKQMKNECMKSKYCLIRRLENYYFPGRGYVFYFYSQIPVGQAAPKNINTI